MHRHLKTSVPLKIFKKIVDEAIDGYMITDNQGTVLYTNLEYLRVTERGEEGVTGHNMREYIADGSIEESAALEAIEAKRTIVKPLMIKDKEALAIISAPVLDRRGEVEYVITTTQNISMLTKTKAKLDSLLRFLEDRRDGDGAAPGAKEEFVAASGPARAVFELADKVRDVLATVIIYGESGAGKDVLARYIHSRGQRSRKPFISVNCGAIPEPILETELFGYAGGTFTGANKGGKQGLFEAAQGGTLFLDEIGDTSLNLQVRLLRVLENRTITRVGEQTEIPVDVRIIAATNKDLKDLVRRGLFREDLFYRLNILPIEVPPLRERRADISALALFFLKKINAQYNLAASLSPAVLGRLEQHHWPGNVRELKNVIERLVVTSIGETINPDDIDLFTSAIHGPESLPGDAGVVVTRLMPLDEAVAELERQLLIKAKQDNKSCRQIASVLGINYTTVARKLAQYGL